MGERLSIEAGHEDALARRHRNLVDRAADKIANNRCGRKPNAVSLSAPRARNRFLRSIRQIAFEFLFLSSSGTALFECTRMHVPDVPAVSLDASLRPSSASIEE